MKQFRICKNCDFPGVYALVNLNNHKVYIGSSKNIKSRLTNHKSKLENNKSHIKEMQEDYNNGNKFIAYVISKVRLRDEKYCEVDDLRYFENEAIQKFDALNPKKGYNKTNLLNSRLLESSNIHFAKENLDFYFSMFDSNFPISEQGRKEEKEEFISKVLDGGRC